MENEAVLVTVFSDAGVSTHRSIAAWGAWIKSERGTVRGGGRFKGFSGCTAVCESRAAINAIHLALKNGIIQKGDRILIQTDNISVPNVLKGMLAKSNRKYDQDRKSTKKAFDELSEKYALSWYWRHVKGHSNSDKARSHVNRFCDKLCTQYLNGE